MRTRLAAPLALVLLWLAALLPTAHAEETPAEGLVDRRVQLEVVERADTWFGDWIVGPIESVLFFDVWVFDNHLPLGEGLGLEVDGELVTDWRPEGYVYQPLVEAAADEVQPVLTDPVVRTFDGISVEIVERNGRLLGRVPEQPVDLPAYGVPPLPAGEVPAEPEVTAHADTPFAFRIDRVREVVVPTEFEVPRGTVPVAAGMEVRHQGQVHQVLEARGPDLRLLSPEERVDPTALPNPDDLSIPAVVAWLILGALFFTLRMGFVQLWAFGHAIRVTLGRFDAPTDRGEISHFQALTSALSATVGLGNIAGVAIAIGLGGPGAVFWMVCAGFLGMASKFTECTLGQMYRVENPDGSVSGGPMHYLDTGLREIGLGPLGKVLAALFAVMCIGGSFGGGNMFQANQSFAAVQDVVPALADHAPLYGIVLALAVGLVIIGGIRRIGKATGIIVPIMCGIYLLAGTWVLIVHAADVPAAFGTIFQEAFSLTAASGGFVGVLIVGFQRAAFSNEAGVGSASIAHSAAKSAHPAREGAVALLEPFIDTIIVCTMTGLVVVVTGTYLLDVDDGVLMTSQAFGTVLTWFPMVLAAAVVLFAFSTMISWSYYGERCAVYLFGPRASLPYRAVFLVFVVFGAVFQLGNVLNFSDLMILGMAFPNILGALILSSRVKRALQDYWQKVESGELGPAKQAA